MIANKFNEYFTNIGPNLANKITGVKGDVSDYIKTSYPNSMFVSDTDPQELINFVQALKESSSAGYDGLSPYIVKKNYSRYCSAP